MGKTFFSKCFIAYCTALATAPQYQYNKTNKKDICMSLGARHNAAIQFAKRKRYTRRRHGPAGQFNGQGGRHAQPCLCPLAGWAHPAHSPPHSRWDGRSAFRPRLERGLYCRVSGLRAFCPRLRDGQHARYVYDNRVRSNTLRRRRDADRQPSAQRS